MSDHFSVLGGRRSTSAAVITNARTSTTEEMSTRIRRYTITMAFRTACFISMIFVSGSLRWVLFAGAVLLPYVAVMFANQSNQRKRTNEVEHGDPGEHLSLTTGGDVITGYVEDPEQTEDRDRRVA